jgi:hypothetical protein
MAGMRGMRIIKLKCMQTGSVWQWQWLSGSGPVAVAQWQWQMVWTVWQRAWLYYKLYKLHRTLFFFLPSTQKKKTIAITPNPPQNRTNSPQIAQFSVQKCTFWVNFPQNGLFSMFYHVFLMLFHAFL